MATGQIGRIFANKAQIHRAVAAIVLVLVLSKSHTNKRARTAAIFSTAQIYNDQGSQFLSSYHIKLQESRLFYYTDISSNTLSRSIFYIRLHNSKLIEASDARSSCHQRCRPPLSHRSPQLRINASYQE